MYADFSRFRVTVIMVKCLFTEFTARTRTHAHTHTHTRARIHTVLTAIFQVNPG